MPALPKRPPLLRHPGLGRGNRKGKWKGERREKGRLIGGYRDPECFKSTLATPRIQNHRTPGFFSHRQKVTPLDIFRPPTLCSSAGSRPRSNTTGNVRLHNCFLDSNGPFLCPRLDPGLTVAGQRKLCYLDSEAGL